MTIALRAQSDAVVTARPPTREDADFGFVVTDREETVTPGSTTTGVEDDKLIETETGATVDHHVDIALQDIVPGTLDELTVESLDEGIVDPVLDGQTIQCDRVSDGTVGILMRTPLIDRRADVTVSRETPATVVHITGGTPGSARKAATDAIDDAIDGLSGIAQDKLIFFLQDHSGADYVRNEFCWAAPWFGKLTCVSPWNSAGGVLGGLTAITKRHVVGPNHGGSQYQLAIGTTARFVTVDNTVVDRTIIGKAAVSGVDQVVYTLDSDLPASITPCKVLSDDWLDYFPAGDTSNAGERIPALTLDQEEKALVDDVMNLADGTIFRAQRPTDATRENFYETKVAGDSGNPTFMILDDELILLSTHTTPHSGPAVHAIKTEINAAIAAADDDAEIEATGYELDEVELSGFVNFDSLVARWRLDDAAESETVIDDMGNHHGAVHGGVTFDGEKATFDGSTGYISVPGHADFQSFTGLTVVGMVTPNFSGAPSDRGQIVCHWMTNDSDGETLLFGYMENGTFRFLIGQGGSNYSATVAWNPVASQTYTFIGTYDGSIGRLYLDGVQVAVTGAVSGTLRNRTGTLWIGQGGSSFAPPVYPFDGAIHEVRIYRRGVSAAEAAAITTALNGT